jgi:uncharacterized protein YcsI (UPF0317 family)
VFTSPLQQLASDPCGVTPQAVIEAAKPPFCITHKAGHMLTTDRLNEEFHEA